MTKYKSREGIHIIELCGEHLIVAERKLWDTCPSMQMMNGFGLLLWGMLEKGTNEDAMVHVLTTITKQQENLVREGVVNYLDALLKNGYILEVEE